MIASIGLLVAAAEPTANASGDSGGGFSSADFLMLVGIILSLFVLAFLAIAETSLNRISRVKAQAIADSTGTKSSAALLRLVTNPERFINPLLVTVTVLQMGQSFLVTLLADSLFGPTGIIVGFILNVIVFFVITEAMPKTWAVLSAERAALLTSRLTDWLVSFPPLRFVSRGLISLTNVLIPGKGLKQGPFVSEQELLGIVGAAAEDEVIEDEERQLIESIIEFGDTVAREVMVPRPDMLIIDNDATVTAALDMAIANGVSRLPVYASDGDDIVGLAYTKDLIRSEREGRGDEPVLDLARPVRFVPENKPVRQLMREMQTGKFHLAIVADEYGGVAGLVTLEDCLEELVGEIVDEYDVEEQDVQRQPNGDYVVAGGTPVGDLSELLDLKLPDEDWDSVGGFIFGTLGHVPEVGEAVFHEGWRFAVAELDGRRIRSVRITYVPEDDPSRSGPTVNEHADADHGS
ncbi:hemolysin family protein [Desertimonas flava]|uniref:hemolysin family protein n=1 Tax=Desertimonas flava TaxID=2064846 RepID=UPI000E352803|nr:hemolysin family protein [Desertimonas flava]